MKRVLDVGNCVPDHTSITQLINQNFDAEVVQVHNGDEAIAALEASNFDLVLVNRLMDRDQSSGLEIIKRIKTDDAISSVPVMMITNFEEHQQLAQNEGAVLGFGKNSLLDDGTIQTLGKYLR